jgi:flagellar secretion chaperone FliS
MSTDNNDGKDTMYNATAMNQYKQVGTQAAIETADPHTLIKMLIDGAIERINKAKYFMVEKDVARKGESISRAISIIDGLKVSLDTERGGKLAENLAGLYDYMQRQLLAANVQNKSENLDEVLSLLNEIRSGWAAIPDDVRKSYQPRES